MKFDVKFTQVKAGWNAEGSVEDRTFDLFGSTLSACLRGVADIVDETLHPKKLKPYKVIYNER